jgi:hypothetical protein
MASNVLRRFIAWFLAEESAPWSAPPCERSADEQRLDAAVMAALDADGE